MKRYSNFDTYMKLYDKLPVDTRDAILTEAAAFSTMLEAWIIVQRN